MLGLGVSSHDVEEVFNLLTLLRLRLLLFRHLLLDWDLLMLLLLLLLLLHLLLLPPGSHLRLLIHICWVQGGILLGLSWDEGFWVLAFLELLVPCECLMEVVVD